MASTSASASTLTSHQALLGIIQDREDELTRMRQMAETAAAQETQTVLDKLSNLQSNHDQSLHLLQEKDRTISSLQEQLDVAQHNHQASIQQLQREHQESIHDQISHMRHQLQDEATCFLKQCEEKQNEYLRREYEEKMIQRETKLQSAHQSSLQLELKRQQISLEKHADRRFSEQKLEYHRIIHGHESTMTKMEEEHASRLRQWSDDERRREQQLVQQITEQCSTVAKENLEKCRHDYENHIVRQDHEQKEMQSQLHQMLQKRDAERLQFEKVQKVLECKVQELMDVLHNVERGYVQKMHDFEEERNRLKDQVQALSNREHTAGMRWKQRHDRHRREWKGMKQRFKGEKMAMRETVKELQRQLMVLKSDKGGLEDTVKDRECEAEHCKRQLKDKITALTKECNTMRDEIRSLNIQLAVHKRNDAAHRDEIDTLLSGHNEAEMTTRKRIMDKFENTLQMDRRAFAEEKLQLVRDRDWALTKKESAVKELDRQRLAWEKMKHELSSAITQLRLDNRDLQNQKEQLETKWNNGEDHRQNLHLKSTIATMRNEMEQLMAMSASSTPPKKPPELPKQSHAGQVDKWTSTSMDQKVSTGHTFNEQRVEAGGLQTHTECIGHSNYDHPLLPSQEDSARMSRRIHELERVLEDISLEYDAVVSERDSLTSVSNKLRAELSQLRELHQKHHCEREQGEQSQFCSSRGNRDSILKQHSSNQSLDGIDVNGLAKSVWTNAIQKTPDIHQMSKLKVKASERATQSQRTSLEKMRLERKKDKAEPDEKVIVKIRNWNQKDDG